MPGHLALALAHLGHSVRIAPVVGAPVPAACARRPLNVRIDGVWRDLSKWRAAHPAGTHWIDGYSDADATEAMQAFHSDEAMHMLSRLPVSTSSPVGVPEPTPLTLSFRQFRAELVQEGYWKRSAWREAATLAPCIALFVAGTLLAQRHALIATFLLAIGSTASGWLAHDYVHGRGRWCALMRPFGALTNGHSSSWWSNKHNLHHARTNEVGVDEDIMSDPFFFLWAPDPARDVQWRKYQHLYIAPVYSILFALWRFNSLKTVATSRLWRTEGPPLALNYLWLALLPAPVAIGHVLLAGLMSATIVTVTHQSEEMFDGPQHDWVDAQFRSTRDAVTSNPFSEWLWGGMQYQLEHHLFPTMPRYRYRQLAPRLKRWAAAHGAEYREDTEAQVLLRNFRMLRDVAGAAAVPGAPATRSNGVFSQRQGAAWIPPVGKPLSS